MYFAPYTTTRRDSVERVRRLVTDTRRDSVERVRRLVTDQTGWANRAPVMHYGRMPVVEATVVVAVPADVAFAVSQTTGEMRYRWDSFVRRQYFLDGATHPAKGVRTFTRSRHGLSMISEYVSYAPPTNVGMKMVRGPWFLEMMAGGWRFASADEPEHTVATWRYHFRTRPALIRPVADRIGIWLLGRDIRRRILGYAQGCQDPIVLASIQVDKHPP